MIFPIFRVFVLLRMIIFFKAKERLPSLVCNLKSQRKQPSSAKLPSFRQHAFVHLPFFVSVLFLSCLWHIPLCYSVTSFLLLRLAVCFLCPAACLNFGRTVYRRSSGSIQGCRFVSDTVQTEHDDDGQTSTHLSGLT